MEHPCSGRCWTSTSMPLPREPKRGIPVHAGSRGGRRNRPMLPRLNEPPWGMSLVQGSRQRPRSEPQMAWLNVETEDGPGVIEIRCAGEVDVGTCAKLIDAFDRVFSGGVEAVRVDLRAVTFHRLDGHRMLVTWRAEGAEA